MPTTTTQIMGHPDAAPHPGAPSRPNLLLATPSGGDCHPDFKSDGFFAFLGICPTTVWFCLFVSLLYSPGQAC